MSSFLRTLIGEDVFSALSTLIASDGEMHPTWCAIHYAEDHQERLAERSRVSLSIEKSLRSIAAQDRPWLSVGLVERLRNEVFSAAASALGEIRAYGALIDAFGTKASGVPAGKAPTPDFVVRNHEETVYVEVATKRMNDGMVRQAATERWLAKEQADESAEMVQRDGHARISVHGYQVESFGLSDGRKVGDHPVSNAISKLCAVKQHAHQFTRGSPVVLWIDLQDSAFWPHYVAPAAPLYSGAPGRVISGSFWHACYGEKDLPLFYIDSFMQPGPLEAMAHSGKFKGDKGTSLSAVMFSLPHATVVFENPDATYRLPDWFRWFLPDLPAFDFERSMVDWNRDGALSEQIAAQKTRIVALAKSMQAAKSADRPW